MARRTVVTFEDSGFISGVSPILSCAAGAQDVGAGPISRRTLMIEARGLSKNYGSTRAVDGLTFDVRPGHVTGFLGPNGAGKSTTMRMIIGLDRPSSGTVAVNGRAYGGIHRPLFEVGAVLEARAVHGGRSAFNHLLCLAQSNGIGRRRVAEVLDLVGLERVSSRRAGTFSLGMSQRLGLAAALLGDPPVLLCDEPVNGLDPEGILWIRTLLRQLAAEGRTVFVSSHLMSEMALTADHLIVVGKGRLIADASTVDLIEQSSMNSVVVRTPDPLRLRELLVIHKANVRVDPEDGALVVTGMDASAIGDLAASHAIALHELSPRRASLEEAFMELTHDSVDFRPSQAA
jgi:ABC-2 type transport system ATP-binding protein